MNLTFIDLEFNEADTIDIISKKWNLIIDDPSFKQDVLVKKQIASFNRFVKETLQLIIELMPPFEVAVSKPDGPKVSATIKFGSVCMYPPVYEKPEQICDLYPKEAKEKNMTYASALYLNMYLKTYKDGEEVASKRYPKCFIGKVPIMIGSKYCRLRKMSEADIKELGESSSGGYFIINGQEKILVAKEKVPITQKTGWVDHLGTMRLSGAILALVFKEAFHDLTEQMRPKIQHFLEEGDFEFCLFPLLNLRLLRQVLSNPMITGNWKEE